MCAYTNSQAENLSIDLGWRTELPILSIKKGPFLVGNVDQ
jgi:hypothetical protein